MKNFSLLLSVFVLFFSANVLLGQSVEITADTDELFCPGEEITLTATLGFDSYAWYYNFSDSNVDGDLFMETGSDNTLTLSASEWAVSYFYVEVDDATCTEPSATVVWDSWNFAGIGISHEANTTICPGDSSLIENAFNGPVNFQWYLDFEPIEGATSSSYWVTAPGTYTLQASYPECPDFYLNSGIGPTFDFYNVQIPVINFETVNGEPNLSVTSGVDIQWYLDGEALFGATGASYTPLSSGAYYVTAIDQNGCSVTSETYIYDEFLSAGQSLQQSILKVFPNPFQGEILLSTNDAHAQGTIRVFDLAGKELINQKLLANALQKTLDLNHLNSGIYLLEIVFTSYI